jgi:DNA-binding CsgD family transcriptional regulator
MVEGQPPAETHRVTGGNPLLAIELSRSLATAPHGTPLEELGSPTVARLVLDRVAKVSPAAVALARALALFAGGAELEDAAAVAGLQPREAEEAADGLVAAQVLADAEPLVFLHPMMRAAVYEQLGVFARRRGHSRAAERLKERGAGIEAIAAHLLAGPPQGDPENLRILRAAADEAVRHVAPRAAARYLERAVAEDAASGEELRALLLDLGRLQRQTSHPAARATLERALAQSASAPQRIEAAVDLAATAMAAGDHEAVGRVVHATREVEARPDDRLTLDMLHAESLWSRGDFRGCLQLVERVPPTLPGDTPAERFALVQSASVRFLRGAPVAETLELLLRSIGDRGADALVAGVDVGDPVGWLITCEAFDEARALAEERMEYARETGNDALYALSQGHIGWIEGDQGNLLAGEAAFRLGLANPGLASHWRTQLTVNLVFMLIHRGRLDEASAELDALEDAGSLMVQSRRAEIAHWAGDAARALTLWQPRLQAENEAGIIHPMALIWRAEMVDSLAAVGRRDEAIAMARELTERSERTGGVAARGAHRLALGRVTGDLHELQRAHEILEPSAVRWIAARARLDLGAALRRGGERVAAREHLRAALDYASRQGAEPLAGRAREELRLAGARPRRAALSGADALTPAEQRIARLAAEGRSNKEIAQHLFLTVKTVEMTLVRAYRKLDIGSRQELPGALEQAA